MNVREAPRRSHLIFEVKELPETPWPLTVGGLPFTINSDKNEGRVNIFPRTMLGDLSISICQDYNVDSFSDKKFRELGAEVYSWFKQNLPKVRIVELMLTSERTIYVFFQNDRYGRQAYYQRFELPGKIAGCVVRYADGRALQRPLSPEPPAAMLQAEPQPASGVIDNTTCDVPGPGVLVPSKKRARNGEVLVQKNHDVYFMTAAFYAVGDHGRVLQGDQDRPASLEAPKIPHVGISLLKLKYHIEFANNSCDTQNLARLATSEDRLTFDICFLDSPYAGNLEGTMVGKSVKLIDLESSNTEDESRYVVYNWCYMGQTEGSEHRVPFSQDTSGSAIWDKYGVVRGFHHHYVQKGPWSGFSASVSASELVEAGYTLASVVSSETSPPPTNKKRRMD